MAASLGPIQVNVLTPVSVVLGDSPDAESPIGLFLQVPAGCVLSGGGFPYRMDASEDGTYTRILTLGASGPTADSTRVLANELRSNGTLLLFRNGTVSRRDDTETHLADFVRFSFDDSSASIGGYGVFLDASGYPQDWQTELRLTKRVAIHVSDTTYSGALTPPSGHSWLDVVGPRNEVTGRPYAEAFDVQLGALVNTLAQAQQGVETTLVRDSDLGWSTLLYLGIGTGIPIRVTHLPILADGASPPVYHKGTRFEQTVDTSGYVTLQPPPAWVRIEYAGCDHSFPYPIAFEQSRETSAPLPTAGKRILHVLSRFFMSEATVSSMADTYEDAEATEDVINDRISEAIAEAIALARPEDFDACLTRVYNREGPARFQFTDTSSFYDATGLSLMFKLSMNLRINRKQISYTLKDVGVIVRLV